jgi:hypothetical protein
MYPAQNKCPAQLNSAQAAPYLIAVALLAISAACTPAFNWRDVGFDSLPVTALLPCKPDRATRTLPIAGVPRAMVMAGCAAGGATFTVAVVTVDNASQIAQAEQALKAANQANYSQYQSRGTVLVQASVYGTPNGARDGPSALSTQAVETFLSGVKLTAQP